MSWTIQRYSKTLNGFFCEIFSCQIANESNISSLGSIIIYGNMSPCIMNNILPSKVLQCKAWILMTFLHISLSLLHVGVISLACQTQYHFSIIFKYSHKASKIQQPEDILNEDLNFMMQSYFYGFHYVNCKLNLTKQIFHLSFVHIYFYLQSSPVQ